MWGLVLSSAHVAGIQYTANLPALLLTVGLFSFTSTYAMVRQFPSLFRGQGTMAEVDSDEALVREANALFGGVVRKVC